MKIKILEYQLFKGNKVKVQSHNYKKNKWIVNPKYEFHQKVSEGLTLSNSFLLYSKENTREVQI